MIAILTAVSLHDILGKTTINALEIENDLKQLEKKLDLIVLLFTEL